MPVDPVILQLKAEVDQYQANLTKAQRHTDDKLDAIEKKGFAMGQKLKQGFSLASAAAVTFIGVLAAERLGQAISQGLEYASSLGEVAQQLGVTTDALQEYRYAATQVGLSAEEMDQALSQLTRRAGEAANGTKAQAQAFEALGISVKTANGELIPTGELIPIISDAMQKIENPAQRAAILMDLFGKSGQKLEPLLSGGSAAINNLRDAAHKLGIVLSSQQIQSADDAADKLAAVKTVLSANIAGTVATNANAILGLADALSKATTAGLNFVSNYPRLSAALAGAALGARAGPWGAAVGGAAGLYVGDNVATSQNDSNMDLQFRMGRLKAAQENYARVKKAAGGPGYWAEAEKELRKQTALTRAATAASRKGGDKPAPAGNPVANVALPAVGGGGASPKAAGGGGSSGPSAREIQHQFDGELASLAMQAISSMQAMAKSADERADLELRAVELAHKRTRAEIQFDEKYSAGQKERLLAQADANAERERERIEFDRMVQKQRDANDLADASYRVEADALKAQLDLTDNREERRQLAFDLLDLEYRYQKSLLESVIASETASQAEKERARVALAGLNNSQAAKRTATGREFASPGERYVSDLAREAENINDAFESAAINGLERLNDGLAKSVQNALGLHGVLGDIVGDFIEIALRQAILRPLAESLFGGGGGGGGGFSLGSAISSISGLFGRAGGGYVQGGQMYRVNEAASAGRVEAFVPQGSGTIIPLGQMNAAIGGGGSTVVQNFHLDARGAVMTQDIVNQINSMGQRAAEAGARGGHALAARDIAQMRRPKL